ncbi:hypothetical protein JHK85_034932 [Glycine max]|nr:hypothetical protein JHK85_034932 [Glycine max]
MTVWAHSGGATTSERRRQQATAAWEVHIVTAKHEDRLSPLQEKNSHKFTIINSCSRQYEDVKVGDDYVSVMSTKWKLFKLLLDIRIKHVVNSGGRVSNQAKPCGLVQPVLQKSWAGLKFETRKPFRPVPFSLQIWRTTGNQLAD